MIGKGVIASRLSPLSALGIGFVAYATASTVWGSGDKAYALAYLWLLILAFFAGRILDADKIWMVVAGFSSLMFGFSLTVIPLNPNYVGAFLAISLAGAIAYRLWYFFPVLGFGLWWCQSRGALLAAAVACLIGLWRWDRFYAICTALIAVLLIVSQKSDGTLSLFSRLGVWQDTINHLTIFGHGWGSFQSTYASWPVHLNMGAQFAPHAYNDYLELISDLGIGAILPVMFVIVAWEYHNPAAKLILITTLALSLTHFPLWIPLVGHMFAYTLGDLTSQERNI